MEPTPQQVEEDVLVGPLKPPPPKLEMPSRRNGLLEDLVILGHVPVPEVVVRDVGLVHQDRRHQLPNGLASINPEDKSFGYLVSVWVRCSRLERHPATRWPRDVLPSGSHVVAAGQPDPSLAEAVHPSVRPLGRRRRWRRWSAARCLSIGTTHGRHCCRGLLKVGWVCWRMS